MFSSRIRISSYSFCLLILVATAGMSMFIFESVSGNAMAGDPRSTINLANFDMSGAIQVQNQMCLSHCPAEWEYHADNLALLGAKICRNNIEWFTCARDYGKEAGIYNFSYYERMISNLHERGIEFLGDFVYGWGWWPNNYDLPLSDWPYFFDFVEAFCQHFKDNITYYEAWNEPDIGFWTGSDEDFYEFVQILVDTVRENDPTSFILSPGISGPDIDYLERLIINLGVEKFNEMFDAVAYHAYCGTNADYLRQKIGEVQAILDRYNIQKESWITEIGLSTSLPPSVLEADYKEEFWRYQATQVIKIYAQSIATNITSTFWYCQNDWCDVNDSHGEGRFGLMYCKNKTTYQFDFKPAGLAYISLNRLINGATFYPAGVETRSVGTSSGGLIHDTLFHYFYTKRNTTALILWSQDVGVVSDLSIVPPSLPPTSSLTSRSQAFNQDASVDFDLIIHDFYTNTSSRIPGIDHWSVDLGPEPIVIELNYSNYLDDCGYEVQPLTVRVELYKDFATTIYTVAIPSILVLGVIIVGRHRFKKLKGQKRIAIQENRNNADSKEIKKDHAMRK
ncbi:MAG: hypothetical protein ACTSXP_04230 [Promethearchaeota archaeon]